MSFRDLKRRLDRLERAAASRLGTGQLRLLTHESADIIFRELLCGEPPSYFTEEQVRAFTEMVLTELHGSPSGRVSP
jgi:hypothetical protein